MASTVYEKEIGVGDSKMRPMILSERHNRETMGRVSNLTDKPAENMKKT